MMTFYKMGIANSLYQILVTQLMGHIHTEMLKFISKRYPDQLSRLMTWYMSLLFL